MRRVQPKSVVFWALSGLSFLTMAASQPTEIDGFHRNGQTFITWSEDTSISGESYRVYVHCEPISAATIDAAECIAEVGEGSSIYHTERARALDYAPDWNGGYTSLSNYVIRDLGPQLSDTTGLCVWTVTSNRTVYYAVTTVHSGTENRSDFGPDNTTGPLTETVADPAPVLVWQSAEGLGRVYTQFMDRAQWNPTFDTPDGDTYAYNYFVGLPRSDDCGSATAPYPVIVHIEGYGSRYEAFEGSHWFCGVEIWCDDPYQSWYYGYSATHDYTERGTEVTTGPIVNFTEQRVLRAFYDTLRDSGYSVDPQRVYVYGHSMGGSGSLAFGMRYPNVFAAVYCSEPMTNYAAASDWMEWDLIPRWGNPSTNLPIENRGRYATHLARYNGTSVWEWQNHQAQLIARRGDEMAHISLAHGTQDTVIDWPDQGRLAYAPFYQSRRAFSGETVAQDHTWVGFAGLGPTVGESWEDPWGPFHGFTVIRDESLPGLSYASGSGSVPPDGIAQFNMNLEWSASWHDWDGPPIDTSGQWGMSLRTTDGSSQTVDVTPRRLQNFAVQAGAAYPFELHRVSDDSIVRSGSVVADSDGLITIEDVAVDGEGVRLRVGAGGDPPPVTYDHTAYLPHIGSSSVWDTFLVVDAAGSSSFEGELDLYQDGEVVSTETFSVAAGGVRVIALDEGTCGRLEYSGDDVTLRAAFLNNEEYGVVEFELDDMNAQTLHYIMPQYIADDLSWMGLAIMNPGETIANATLEAINAAGQILATSQTSIAGLSRSVGFVWTYFPDLDYRDVARIRVQSDRPICGINISGAGNARLLFTRAIGSNVPTGTRIISHIATQWSFWNNYLVFDNIGTTTANALVTLYAAGTQVYQESVTVSAGTNVVLDVNEIAHLDPDNGTVLVSSGQLVVRQSYQNTAFGGTAEFFLKSGPSQTLAFNFPGYISDELDWMGMAVCNTSDRDAAVNLIPYFSGVAGSQVSVVIDAHTRYADVLSNIFGSHPVDRVIVAASENVSGLNISGSGHARLLFMPAFPGPDVATPPPPPPPGGEDTSPPEQTVKLIFVHHSTGEAWLADWSGQLGQELRDNNYFVSDTNYGWGPDDIGDRTDTGHWYDWFLGPHREQYLNALYNESQQHCEYSRRSVDPGGENRIIMFKSCFPNSHIGGNPNDPPRPAGDPNPLWGEGSWSDAMTVENVKGLYRDLLTYFQTRQDKLFVLIVPPALIATETDAAHAANARAVADWLVADWLDDYPHRNVAVFDFFNVLTSNGGDTHTHDANQETGNHHRYWNGAPQHIHTFENDFSMYGSGDSHPTEEGGQKATIEFVPLLNSFVHQWQATKVKTQPRAASAR